MALITLNAGLHICCNRPLSLEIERTQRYVRFTRNDWFEKCDEDWKSFDRPIKNITVSPIDRCLAAIKELKIKKRCDLANDDSLLSESEHERSDEYTWVHYSPLVLEMDDVCLVAHSGYGPNPYNGKPTQKDKLEIWLPSTEENYRKFFEFFDVK